MRLTIPNRSKVRRASRSIRVTVTASPAASLPSIRLSSLDGAALFGSLETVSMANSMTHGIARCWKMPYPSAALVARGCVHPCLSPPMCRQHAPYASWIDRVGIAIGVRE